MSNMYLCGFMGCGKSTVGEQLARQLNRRFIDLDTYIESQAGMTVSAIFECFGEADFRKREQNACRELAGQDELILALGGGTATYAENVRILSQNGIIVYLRVSPQTVLARLQGDATRPLLQTEDKEEAINRLFAAREKLYEEAATVTVDAEQSPQQVAAAIIAACDRKNCL